jgi:signal transduction histidine kinase
MARVAVNHAGVAVRQAIRVDRVGFLKRIASASPYVVLLVASYYLAARLGLRFRFQNSQIGVVWPANAVMLSALLLTRKTQWWVVLAATALAHAGAVGATVPTWRLLWQIAGNAAFNVTTVEALRRVAGLPLDFGRRHQVVTYIAASFVMPALFAPTTPAFIRSLLNLEPQYSPPLALLRTTLSNATAMLLTTPLVLLWARYGFRELRELSVRRLGEAGAIGALLVAMGLVSFRSDPEVARFPLLWIFPPLLWAAVRFGPIGASTSLFCVAALSVWGTAERLGPFVLPANTDQVLSLQLFWIMVCPPVMLLAAAIREREQVEKTLQEQRNQLAHVTRVATVSELAGALAHELSQPLTAILINVQAAIDLLARRPGDVREMRAILEDIRQQDRQAASVIAQLRSFLRAGESHFERLSIETVVRNALALGRSTIEAHGVEVQTQFAADLPPLRGDPVQLLQIVLNLVVNGCEAMSSIAAADRHLAVSVARLGQGHVDVAIIDFGIGLPHGSQERVFEPFFTTKPKGLGLGLTICRSIATTHHGQLWAENNTQAGATFHLVLPADVHLPQAELPSPSAA